MNDILPLLQDTPLVTIYVDIICVPKEENERVKAEERERGEKRGERRGEKRREKRGKKRVLEIIEKECEPQVYKKLKECIESEGILIATETEDNLVPVLPQFVTTPNEDSATDNIFKQVCSFGESNGLYVASRKGAITDIGENRYTKFGKSRPDITSYQKDVIINKDYTQCVYVQGASDVSDGAGDGKDDLIKKMTKVSLNCEAKKDKNPPMDPIAQLLAGMEKTMGDNFVSSLMHGRFLERFTLYGLYFIAKDDTCTVIRADVNIGRKTPVQQGVETLKISDAFNRVFYQLLNS